MKNELRVYIPERKAQTLATPHGLHKVRAQKGRFWVIPERKKRGAIKTFSRSASARLRKALLQIPTTSGIYGVTLTFKDSAWKNVLNKDADAMRELYLSFVHKLRRNAKKGNMSEKFYFFWRVELQKNKTPHFHLVVNTDCVKDIFTMREMFFKTVYERLGYGCPDNAYDMRELNDANEAFSYVCSHASKHKRDQLGWEGKQWGLIFPTKTAKEFYKSGIIVEHNASYVELERKEEVKINRILRKMHWARLRDKCVSVDVRKKLISREGKSKDDIKSDADLYKELRKKSPSYYYYGFEKRNLGNTFIPFKLRYSSKSRKFSYLMKSKTKGKLKRGSLRKFCARLSSLGVQFTSEDTAKKLMRCINE